MLKEDPVTTYVPGAADPEDSSDDDDSDDEGPPAADLSSDEGDEYPDSGDVVGEHACECHKCVHKSVRMPDAPLQRRCKYCGSRSTKMCAACSVPHFPFTICNSINCWDRHKRGMPAKRRVE